jgi:hypothetical protein
MPRTFLFFVPWIVLHAAATSGCAPELRIYPGEGAAGGAAGSGSVSSSSAVGGGGSGGTANS